VGVTATAPARALSNTTSTRRAGGKGYGFWSKWNSTSQQQFEQEVSFDGDKRSERRRSPLKQISDDANRLSPRDDYDDLEFTLEDSFEVANPRDRKPLRSVDEANAMRDALLDDDAVSARRRAELLGMLDELGPTSFAPPPAYPSFAEEKKKQKREQQDLFSGPEEMAVASLGMVQGFIDATKLRDSGALPAGGYFAHVLHTRRVSKTTGGGKIGSFSILAVVGNGQGTAGFGLGKDADATSALVKAVRAAKKNMLHIERFDNRTIFHDMEDKWAACKVRLGLGVGEAFGLTGPSPVRRKNRTRAICARRHG